MTNTEFLEKLIEEGEELKQYFTQEYGDFKCIAENKVGDLAQWISASLRIIEKTENKSKGSAIYIGFSKYCSDIENVTTINLDICVGDLKGILETYHELTVEDLM